MITNLSTRSALEVIGGDMAVGKQLYDGVCAACHGKDGTTIKFRFEGLDATLGTLAALDPWRFLHKTRYGTPGTSMGKVVGVDQQWTAQQGRDVLLYAQSLVTGSDQGHAAGRPGRNRQGTDGRCRPGGRHKAGLTGLATAFRRDGHQPGVSQSW